MNEESNTTTIIVVLVVLGLLVIGTIFLTRFIVRRISRAFSRQPSQQRAGQRETKEKKGSPKDAPGSAFKEPTLGPKTSAREHTAPKTQRPEAPVARTAPPKSQTPESPPVVGLSSGEFHPQEASSPPKEPTPKTTRQTRTKRRVGSGWVPKDGSAYVAGREIGGMVYVGRGHLRASLVSRTMPSSIQARVSLGTADITRVRGCATGPTIQPSLPGHERLILIGYRAAAPILATMSDTYFFTSMGLRDASLSTRRTRRNVPTLLPRFAGYLRYTATTTRYAVTLAPSSIRPASWNQATTPSPSSSTMVTRCRRMSCSRLVDWRREALR